MHIYLLLWTNNARVWISQLSILYLGQSTAKTKFPANHPMKNIYICKLYAVYVCPLVNLSRCGKATICRSLSQGNCWFSISIYYLLVYPKVCIHIISYYTCGGSSWAKQLVTNAKNCYIVEMVMHIRSGCPKSAMIYIHCFPKLQNYQYQRL
jgi:hypothetical protein